MKKYTKFFVSFGICTAIFLTSISCFAIEIVDKTVFKIDLEKYDIKVRATQGGKASNVREQTKKLGGEAGLNASFFCPAESSYSRCGANNGTSSERIINGQDISVYPNDTGTRGIFGFDKDGSPLFVQNNLGFIAGYMKNTNAERRSEIYNGIGNFPILLDGGINTIYSYGDFLEGNAKFSNPGTRGFICNTQDNKTIYMGFVRNISMREISDYIRKQYGCDTALSLDAGLSTALVYRDSYLIGPGRDVVDGFVAVPKDWRVEEMIQGYELTKKDADYYVFLRKLLLNAVDKKGDTRRTKAIKALETMEKDIHVHGNIPKRVILRKLHEVLSRPITQQ